MSHTEKDEVEISQTSTLFDVLKSSPVDYSHESLIKDGCYLNKVMLNQFDNGRTFDFEPDSLYNQNNKGIIKNLLWVQFDSSKVK